MVVVVVVDCHWPPRTIPAVSLQGEGEEEANLYHLAIVAVVVAEKKKKTNWQSLWAHRLSLSLSLSSSLNRL